MPFTDEDDDLEASPLEIVCRNGDSEELRTLLSDGSEWSPEQQGGALMEAAVNGHVHCLRMLLAEASFSAMVKQVGAHALAAAAGGEYPEAVVALLADQRVDANARVLDDGSTPLMQTIFESALGGLPLGEKTVLVVRLLAQASDLSIEDFNGLTPLMLASVNGRERLIAELLPGANPRQITAYGEAAFDYAVGHGAWAGADALAEVSDPERVAAAFAHAGPQKMPRWAARLEAQALRDEVDASQPGAPQARTVASMAKKEAPRI
jgi:ankyrin repeat protein